MPSTTAKGFRQQDDADPVADLALGIRNLAADVNNKVGLVASGSVTINIGATGTPVSAAVTFPAGLFTAAPDVQVSLSGSTAPQNFSPPSAAGVTNTGCNIWVTRTAGAAASINVAWTAHQ